MAFAGRHSQYWWCGVAERCGRLCRSAIQKISKKQHEKKSKRKNAAVVIYPLSSHWSSASLSLYFPLSLSPSLPVYLCFLSRSPLRARCSGSVFGFQFCKQRELRQKATIHAMRQASTDRRQSYLEPCSQQLSWPGMCSDVTVSILRGFSTANSFFLHFDQVITLFCCLKCTNVL